MSQYRIMWESKSGTKGNGSWNEFESQYLVNDWVRESNSSPHILKTWVEYRN